LSLCRRLFSCNSILAWQSASFLHQPPKNFPKILPYMRFLQTLFHNMRRSIGDVVEADDRLWHTSQVSHNIGTNNWTLEKLLIWNQYFSEFWPL
jgi:hypothetical protein